MILPSVGDEYPMGSVGPHGTHVARIVALDLHGEPSWEIRPMMVPTITVRCSCGLEFRDDLIEAVPDLQGRRSSVA